MSVKIDLNKNGTGIIFEGKEISFYILQLLISPENRVLYRFSMEEDVVIAKPFLEDNVLWLEESDIVRNDKIV